MSQGKIVWTAYQILASTSYSIDYVPFPKTFGKLARVFMSIVLFDIGLPMTCLFHGYNDYRRLLVRTLGPIVMSVLLGIIFGIKARCCGLHERYIPSHTSIQITQLCCPCPQM